MPTMNEIYAERASKRMDLDEAASFLDGISRGIDAEMSALKAAEQCIRNATGRENEAEAIRSLLQQAMTKVEALEAWVARGANEGGW